MIVLGVILLVLGLVLGINILFVLGIVLAVAGVALLCATSAGRGPGRYWWLPSPRLPPWPACGQPAGPRSPR